jgi:hypothetical protein
MLFIYDDLVLMFVDCRNALAEPLGLLLNSREQAKSGFMGQCWTKLQLPNCY